MRNVTVEVVGLGPGDASFLTARSIEAINNAHTARLRTSVHPAASAFTGVASYDEVYEHASDFDALYDAIVQDLVNLAEKAPDARVVYAVPGSPLIAERTVQMLRERDDVDLVVHPAVSVIDVAANALGIDPMAVSLRVVDALEPQELVGPGPLLVLQTYSPEVLALVGSRLAPDCWVTVLHHLGLVDERIETLEARHLAQFSDADHLTSIYIETLDGAGAATERLVALTRVLREQCAWDKEQTHASLLRHLLEEAYEAMDALETYVARDELDPSHVIEELGDVLFQIAFHAQLASEVDQFDFADVANAVHDKLVSRHPHVFADIVVSSAQEAATNWEILKQKEKRRESVTAGVPMTLPSLTLLAKLRRKASAVGLEAPSAATALRSLNEALGRIEVRDIPAGDLDNYARPEWGQLIEAVSDLARYCGVDLEAVARSRALRLRDEIVSHEG